MRENMKYNKGIVVLAVIVGLSSIFSLKINAEAPESIQVDPIIGISPEFIKGADISMLKQIELSGGKYYENGVSKDCLQILKDHGVNWLRLKIWVNPKTNGVEVGGGNNDEAKTLEMAARAKALGFKVLIDFHYSDFWTDPGQQSKPVAWSAHSGKTLQKDVYEFTSQVLKDLKRQGTMPDMVQIGNEINNGMLWPDGKLSGKNAGGFSGLAELLKQGITAVRDNDPDKKVRIMIHLANGGDNALFRKFFDEIIDKEQVTDFDVIGVSYYPYWHGSLDQLKTNLEDISLRYNKEVMVAETAYGFTLQEGDQEKNIFSAKEEAEGGYKASVQGQAACVRNIMEVVANVPNGKGKGVFYWEPDWIPVAGAPWKTGAGNGWENQAMFDFQGNALPSLNVFNQVSKARE